MFRRMFSLFLLLLSLGLSHAQTNDTALTIFTDSTKYSYHGCYNETTQIEGSAGTRALDGGKTEVRGDEMTVPLCLEFCGDGQEEYLYAGLEWGRECWCAQSLAGIAEKLDDDMCDMACEGDDNTACGGTLRLSVYRLSSAAASLESFGGLVALASSIVMLLL